MFGQEQHLYDNVPDQFRPEYDAVARNSDDRPMYREQPVPAATPGMQRAVGRVPSPDGLGAYAHPMTPPSGGLYEEPLPQGLPAPYPTPTQMAQYQAPYEPGDVSPEAAVRSAGITTLAVALAFGAGLALAGWRGGIAGVLLTGSAFNGYRAQKWWGTADAGEKHEAVTSAVLGVAGLVSGGYVAYKAYESAAEDDED